MDVIRLTRIRTSLNQVPGLDFHVVTRAFYHECHQEYYEERTHHNPSN